MLLSDKKLMQVTGGGYGIWAGIAGIITFIISVVDGFINPVECN